MKSSKKILCEVLEESSGSIFVSLALFVANVLWTCRNINFWLSLLLRHQEHIGYFWSSVLSLLGFGFMPNFIFELLRYIIS